jgi:putative PIN family toxin of toxin-antitoxin system
VRLLLDANVIVSATLSSRGAPRTLIEAWLAGEVELVVCPQLLREVERTLASPKIAARVSPEEAGAVVGLLREAGELVPDPADEPPLRSPDPDDDYLLALAAREHVPLVTGDRHLLELGPGVPVFTPRASLSLLENG